MEIIKYKTFSGRNIYSHKPVMELTVDVGYDDIPTKDIKGFNEKLISAFPNLKKHTCSLGYEGGFTERLEKGTFLAHTLEHAILDIQNTLGFNVKYGKTITVDNSLSTLIFEYENKECALECCYAAVDILNSFIYGDRIDIDMIFETLFAIKDETEPGPSTAAILEEAKKRNIPITRIGKGNLFRLGYGNKSKLIQATLTESTSCIAADICSDKQQTKTILAKLGVPVPEGYIAGSESSALDIAHEIGFPVVLKPLNLNQGKGVYLNLQNSREVEDSYRNVVRFESEVIVEKYLEGSDYRVLVVGDKVAAAAQRLPATVTGDGCHTIDELVETANQDAMRGEGHSRALTKIKLDKESLMFLRQNNLDPRDVPEKGKNIKLRANGNLSTGGTAIDCTDLIHPDNAEIAVKCAKALGVDIAGIDIIARDISEPILASGGAVIEVNAAPGLRMHLYPLKGQSRNVAKDIVDMLYPNNTSLEFPIVSVTGTNGKTTTVRLISHILKFSGKSVGMTNTTGSYINGKRISKGDHSGPESARELLSDKTIEAAVFETARGGIIRKGLGYDLADVGVITNVTNDHLGQNKIMTIEEMVNIKSLVVEAVKPNGYAVLNAEDPMTNLINKNVDVKIIYFYSDAANVKVENIKDTVKVFAEDGFIKIKNGKRKITVQKIDEIPVTFYGLSDCNIKNCLAAVSALYALKIPVKIIAKGLLSFVENLGRFQVFEMNGYKIMLDYAHNLASYKEVVSLCKKIDHKRLVGIIGMPGDRLDDSVKEIGIFAAQSFDKIYIKEDKDLRKRAKNEIPSLLKDAIINTCKIEPVFIEDEAEALRYAMLNAESGDLIVMLYEKLEPLIELINEHKSLYNDVKFFAAETSVNNSEQPENLEASPGNTEFIIPPDLPDDSKFLKSAI